MGVAQMSKVVIIGAGKTGRGFLARLLKDQEIVFIDKNRELIEALNTEKKIDVDFFGGKKPSLSIEFVAARTWETVEASDFEGAEVILVSVGGTNLADVGAELKKYVTRNTKIIVCENASSPAKKLGAAIGIDGLKIAESTVFCTTIEKEKDSLAINSEWYPYLQFDGDVFDKHAPEFDGLKAVTNFGGFLDRKLFTYNSASCIIAYLGALKGYTVYSDAANDEEILALLDKNYEIINECICKEYGYGENDQKEFALLSRDKFTDKTLVDTVARNAREPQRKITRNERIVSPMLLQQKYGKDSSILEKTLAAALLYTPEEETEWNKMLSEQGYEGILQGLCGLDKDSTIYARILKMVQSKNIL
jgi:mannitol-1-phosphate 5-dehydrogenase